MANWCFNDVTFGSSSKEKLDNLLKDFLYYDKTKTKTGDGFRLPCADDVNDLYMFHFSSWVHNDGLIKSTNNPYYSLSVSFSNKWSDSSESIEKIGRHYGVNFEHFFSEPNSSLYGQAVLVNGIYHRYKVPDDIIEEFLQDNTNEDDETDFDAYSDQIADHITKYFKEFDNQINQQ